MLSPELLHRLISFCFCERQKIVFIFNGEMSSSLSLRYKCVILPVSADPLILSFSCSLVCFKEDTVYDVHKL